MMPGGLAEGQMCLAREMRRRGHRGNRGNQLDSGEGNRHVSSPDCQTKHTYTLIGDKNLIQEPIIPHHCFPRSRRFSVPRFPVSVTRPFSPLRPFTLVPFFCGLFVPSLESQCHHSSPHFFPRWQTHTIVRLSRGNEHTCCQTHAPPHPSSCSRYIRAGVPRFAFLFLLRVRHVWFCASPRLRVFGSGSDKTVYHVFEYGSRSDAAHMLQRTQDGRPVHLLYCGTAALRPSGRWANLQLRPIRGRRGKAPR
jgi:hypothetical protein